MIITALLFQSTHPVWGATDGVSNLDTFGLFQSTHPVWGATDLCPAYHCCTVHFNPRTPCGVRLIDLRRPSVMADFNPRTPCGVRRCSVDYIMGLTDISIHAPRVGCDYQSEERRGQYQTFQSTHPVWGATETPPF